MAHRADDIRHDIADTRAAMTEKLVMLEERVRETVIGVHAAVEEIVEDVGGLVKDVGGIVENVKATVDTTLTAVRQGVAGAQSSVAEIVEHVQETVGDTVATVQRTFDLPSQVEHHPWSMFGGALLAGSMLGSWGGRRTSAAGSTRDTSDFAAGPRAERATDASRPESLPASRPSSARPEPQQGIVSGVLEQLKDELKDEMASLKSVAVGAVLSTLRDRFKQAMPTMAPHPESAVTKLGGPPSDRPAQPA